MQNQKHHDLESKLIDYIQLSPIQRYIKYKEFPWASIMTLCLVFVTTLTIQSSVLGPKVQERNIQVFFNYHILQHQNVDIYQATDVFTVSTQQYKDFKDMVQFFNRTLTIMSNLNQYNFYESNQTQIDRINHTITRYFDEKLAEREQMTIQQMIDSNFFSFQLKEYLRQVKRMEMVFHINNFTLNTRNIDVIVTINVKQKFQIKVELLTKVLNQTFTEAARETSSESQNLKVRKLPSHHHQKFAPYNVGYFFRLVIILLSFHEGIMRVLIYRQHPFTIRGISQGQSWDKLPLLHKCKLMGWWNIIAIVLNILGLVGGGAAVFTAWVQLVRYIQYTENPYIITFLGKNILRLMLIVIFTAFFVITGFVLFSMVKFSYIYKFEETELAYFTYVFNNFQYGIYENFMDIGRYGGFYQFLYFMFCFYMVWCTNNIVPSIICNTVINKNRLKYLTKFFKQIRIPCPVCQHITNQEAQRAVKRTYGMLSVFAGQAKESQVEMKIESPKILPFLSPKLLPASKTKIRSPTEEQEDRPKRTKFEIVEDLNVKLDISSTQLYRQKVELLRKKIEQSLLELDIFGDRGHNKVIKTKLRDTNDKVNLFKAKIDKKMKALQEKNQLKKAVDASKKINASEDPSEKSQKRD